MPGKAGADLVFLQQGPVLCEVPGWVPHTWRSQLHPGELRVSADTKRGRGTEWQGNSAKGLRVVGEQSKPTGGDLQVSGLSLGACAGLDGLRKEAEPLGLRVRRGDSCTEAAGGPMGVAGMCSLIHVSRPVYASESPGHLLKRQTLGLSPPRIGTPGVGAQPRMPDKPRCCSCGQYLEVLQGAGFSPLGAHRNHLGRI